MGLKAQIDQKRGCAKLDIKYCVVNDHFSQLSEGENEKNW